MIKKRKEKFYYFIICFWLLLVIIKSIYNINFGVENRISDILLKFSIVNGIVSLWSLYDIVIKKETPNKILLKLSYYSFFIYLIHEPILLGSLKMLSIIFIKKNELLTSFFYFFKIILCIIIAKILQKYTPKLYSFIIGGR